jgi:hypothetical protein
MALNPTATFPTTIASIVDPLAATLENAEGFEHDLLHQKENNEIEAVQTKVGINNSADTSSLDYKLTSTSSSNPGHKHTLANGATDITASANELNTLDGITSSTNELNILDGVIVDAAEINRLDGLTSGAVGLTDVQAITNKTLTAS